MARRKTMGTSEKLTRWIPMVSLAGSFATGLATGGIWFVKNVATVPYVDGKAEEGRKYTDEKVADGVKEAVDHSDLNRQEIMTEVKSLGTKQDLMLDTLRTIQQGQYLEMKHSK